MSLASAPLLVAVGPFDGPEGPITAIDARVARLTLAWASEAPLCCARGALVDGRAKLALEARAISVAFVDAPPALHATSPSGVVVRLAGEARCAALADATRGVRGDGCALRAEAAKAGLREDAWLLDGCAIFPIDREGDALVPSPRIPEHALVPIAEGARSLWDEARERVALRYGEDAARAIDAIATDLRQHRSRALHLKVR